MQNFIVGKSQAIQRLMERIDSVAQSDLSILLFGETGTGKNMIATYIHQASRRQKQPFVILDCARMNPNLVESELFGHKKGAFTGAVSKKIGLFEMANNGTLFLNEIENLSLEIQAKLLHVLETGSFRRVGGDQDLQSNFRLISATNEDILRLIENGRFRLDLYYRINELIFTVPSLRERRKDILCFAERFVKEFCCSSGKTVEISDAAQRLLTSHSWPGNIRELRNVLHRAVILTHNKVLLPEDFPTDLRMEAQLEQAKQEQWSLQKIERQHIAAILDETAGNLSKAHKILDIGYSTLVRKIKKYDISKDTLTIRQNSK